MFKDIVIGQYIPANSFIHKMDPKIKILLIFSFIILLFFINTVPGYIAATVFAAIMVIGCKIPFKFILKGIKPMIYIFLFTGIFNLFLTGGETAWSYSLFGWNIRITYEGIRAASVMVVRLLYIVLASTVLTLTTSPLQLTDGIERLLKPLGFIKVPVHEIAMMMSIALRFIPTLAEEMDKIRKAQMARGADFESGNIIKRAKALIPLLVPLFISAFRRADDLAVAMESRCYHGGKGRTKMKQTKMARRDYFALFVFLVLVGVVIVFEIIF